MIYLIFLVAALGLACVTVIYYYVIAQPIRHEMEEEISKSKISKKEIDELFDTIDPFRDTESAGL